ncbi:SunI/YnzG family protein [Macrococcus animalis]|uniref:SunI/YnzG family protein n=1 Tax=Macrococcus animalis TaxID=3395467 RepID=UPI0039BFD517
MAMRITKNEKEVNIKWRVADITIPNEDILSIKEDTNIYAGAEENNDEKVVRIGSTFGKTNRILLDTKDKKYIIYTHNDKKIIDELNK